MASGSERSRWERAWRDQNTPWVNAKSDLFLKAERHRLKRWRAGKALVPLAGNSPAVRMLHDLGMDVTAVEYVPAAVRALLREQFPRYKIRRQETPHGRAYRGRRLTVRQEDFFLLPTDARFDLIYDRAAIVAILPRQRKRYAKILCRAAAAGGALFIVAYEFIGKRRAAPPFSLSRAELLKLFPGWRVKAGAVHTYGKVEPRFVEQGITRMRSCWVLLTKTSKKAESSRQDYSAAKRA